jgi:hypothetical protein
LNTRSEGFRLFERIGENKRFIYIMGSVFIAQTLIIQIGGKVFGTTAINIKALLISMLLGFLIIPVDMIRKLIVKSIHKN